MFQPASRGDAGRVEIRISFDTLDPPAGRLRMLAGRGAAGGPGTGSGLPAGQEVRFCGWLGLLRALYEVTGSPASGAPHWP
jgi:hypothetical protein